MERPATTGYSIREFRIARFAFLSGPMMVANSGEFSIK